MALRPIARLFALCAILIAAVVPTAALSRTVCVDTGQSAVGWSAANGCALAVVDAPACCDHGENAPGEPGDDACCKRSPALGPTLPPAAESGPDLLTPDAPIAWAAEPTGCRADTTDRRCAPPRATGPPIDAATRRHLRARRVDVLTI